MVSVSLKNVLTHYLLFSLWFLNVILFFKVAPIVKVERVFHGLSRNRKYKLFLNRFFFLTEYLKLLSPPLFWARSRTLNFKAWAKKTKAEVSAWLDSITGKWENLFICHLVELTLLRFQRLSLQDFVSQWVHSASALNTVTPYSSPSKV